MAAAMACLFSQSAFAFRLYTVGGDADCSFPDIQSAINNAIDADGNSVLVARSGTYSNQHLVITGQNINILGGLDNCSSSDYSGQTTINGTSGHSVIEIEGNSNVYLANLFITGGNLDADHSGGGIYFGGQGSLALANSMVSLNTAGYGGGINVNGSSGPTTLTLYSDTLILNNTAQTSGGGIRVEGDTRLYVLQPNTLIAYNDALGGYGGGIEVLGPARADIGSPGYGALGVIFFNNAQYGGGIAAVTNSDQSNAVVRLFTTDGANPVQVANNDASVKGGGIYLKSYIQFFPFELADAMACASNYRINDNVAPDGAAIYADRDQDISGVYAGSTINLNQSDPCGPEPAEALGAVPCAQGVACSEMARNVAAQSDATPTDGATILVDNTGVLYAEKLVLRNNSGGRAIRLIGETNPDSFSQPGGSLSNCLLVDNELTAELIRDEAFHQEPLTIDACAFANNAIGTQAVMHNEDALSMTNALIYQPGKLTLEYSGSRQVTGRYVLASDVSTLPGDVTIQTLDDPRFADAASGNYHLQTTSPAVDYAGGVGGFDLEGNPRDVDLPQAPNAFGPRDLGPYERQLACAGADTIFCDGFEAP